MPTHHKLLHKCMTSMVLSSNEQLKTSHLHPEEKPSFDSMQAGPSSIPPALASSRVLTPSPDLASLAQSVAAPESLPSGSGDTGIDQGRGSGTSWGRSSDDRRQGEASQSEQGGGGSDTKVPQPPSLSTCRFYYIQPIVDMCIHAHAVAYVALLTCLLHVDSV